MLDMWFIKTIEKEISENGNTDQREWWIQFGRHFTNQEIKKLSNISIAGVDIKWTKTNEVKIILLD